MITRRSPQGGRVETAVWGLASAAAPPSAFGISPLGGESGDGGAGAGKRGASPLCLRHLPVVSGGERGNGDYAQVSSGGEWRGWCERGVDAWLERAGPGEQHPDQDAGECAEHG